MRVIQDKPLIKNISVLWNFLVDNFLHLPIQGGPMKSTHTSFGCFSIHIENNLLL